VAQGSILAINLLAIIPAVHINTANMHDKKSFPAVQRPNEIQAKRIIFSLSPPKSKIGLVKLCNKGVLVF
jgi:hypothetical protein